MNAAALDPISTLAPLEALAAPAPRHEEAGSSSFAEHLAAPPAEKTKDSSTQQRTERNQAQTPIAAPSSPTKPAENPAEQSPAAATSTETGDGAHDEQPSPVADAATSATVQKEEDTEEDPAEVASEDELLLTTAVVASPVVVEAPQKVAAEDVAEEQVPALAEDNDKEKAKRGGVIAKAKTPLRAAEKSEAVPEASQQSDTDAQAIVTTSLEQPSPTNAAETATEETANVAVSTLLRSQRTKKGEKVQPAQEEVEDAPAADQERAVAADTKTAEVQPVVARREGKRERNRAESKPGIAPRAEKTDSPTAAAPSEAAAAPPPTTLPAAPVVDATTPSATNLPTPPVVTAAPPPVVDAAQAATQRLPQHLTGRSTERARGSAPVTPAEQTRFVQRVAKAFQTAHARGGELQLRLSPPALGSLKLEIKLQDGVMSARIEAENQDAKNMLIDNLPVLKERLAEQGVQVERFDVDLMDRQPQGQPDAHEQRERRQAMTVHRLAPTREAETPNTSTAAPSVRNDGRLNVTV